MARCVHLQSLLSGLASRALFSLSPRVQSGPCLPRVPRRPAEQGVWLVPRPEQHLRGQQPARRQCNSPLC
uniref:Uncharacterized protein n=1 Tax=Anguilla anguilla TaxID=7936 RepID=A0A0E9WPQ0_ANGAN